MSKTQRDEIKGIGSHLDDPFLHQSTVAAAIGRSPSTIGRWIDDGIVKTVEMPNGLKKIRRSELIAWLQTTAFGPEVVEAVSKLKE